MATGQSVTATTISTIELSSVSASAARGSQSASIQLHFDGPLDSVSASDAQHYGVKVNGVSVPVTRAIYNVATNTVILEFAADAFKTDDTITGSYDALRDSSGSIVTGTFGPVVAR
jgi:hypothetical protein